MKKYRRAMSHDSEESCKVWKKKLTLGSKNDMKNLVNLNSNSVKSKKLYFDVLLLPKVYYVCAKNVQRGYVSQHWSMTQNFRRNWLCFARWHGEFRSNIRKSQCLYFIGLLLSEVYNIWAKKLQRICHDTERWCNIDSSFDKLHKTRNFINFHASSCKSKNVHFDGLVLSKAYKVLDEKLQKGYASWYWRVVQRKPNSWEICIFCVMQ